MLGQTTVRQLIRVGIAHLLARSQVPIPVDL